MGTAVAGTMQLSLRPGLARDGALRGQLISDKNRPAAHLLGFVGSQEGIKLRQ